MSDLVDLRPTLSIRFWRWLHAYARRRVQSAWLDRHHHDRTCPHCHQPWAVVGLPTAVRAVDQLHEETTCRGCGRRAVWSFMGMLPEYCPAETVAGIDAMRSGGPDENRHRQFRA